MSQKINPAGTPFTDDNATIAAALEEASIPTLMLAMIHMTGDTGLLEGELRPLGVYLNEYQGYMPPEQQAQVRAMALEVIVAFRDGGCQLPPPPSPETVHKMMEFLVAEEVSPDYVPMMLEEMELDGEDARQIDFGAHPGKGTKGSNHAREMPGWHTIDNAILQTAFWQNLLVYYDPLPVLAHQQR